MKRRRSSSPSVTPNPIRLETAISRYPIHCLFSRGTGKPIRIREEAEDGADAIRWDVYYSEYGRPGPLAYRLDSLVVNRRLERRPLPRNIELGSLKSICRELGIAASGENVKDVKRALRANAMTDIVAKLRYRTADGGQRVLDTTFSRYSVTFIGDTMLDGRRSNCCFIGLNETFRDVLNSVTLRPLDFDYLKVLAPGPQRFYELLSYQMYAVLRHGRPRAKLSYSEFCTYAPQTRYTDAEKARKQMYKLHAPHLAEGYIAEVGRTPAVDKLGEPDWVFSYSPGPRAKREYAAFSGQRKVAVPPPPLPRGEDPLVAELVELGVSVAPAGRLVDEHGSEAVARQIMHLRWLLANKPGSIDSPAGWLVSAIRVNQAAPPGFARQAKRKASEVAADTESQARREQVARERKEHEAIQEYWANLTTAEQGAIDAECTGETDGMPYPELMRKVQREAIIKERIFGTPH